MNAKITDTDEPLGDLQVIPDFLPAPEELAFRDDTVKVTILSSTFALLLGQRVKRRPSRVSLLHPLCCGGQRVQEGVLERPREF